jgi:hypothetical protein
MEAAAVNGTLRSGALRVARSSASVEPFHMQSSPTSLILGAATRIPPSFVRPFVESLRNASYGGRVGFVIGQYPPAQRYELERLADFIVWADDCYPIRRPRTEAVLKRVRSTRRVRRVYPPAFRLAAAVGHKHSTPDRRRSLEYRLEGLQSLRYQRYLDILESQALDADQVMITDLRDVLFQDDPFRPPVTQLEVFLEEPSATFATEPHNRRWIRDLYGARALRELSHLVISCSGTVIGPRQEVIEYLRQMSAAADRRRRPLGSHDQAIHNHLLRHERLGDNTLIVPNGHGRVLTMGAMTSVVRDDAGRVLNLDGSVPAVIHQYDRHPSLAPELVRISTGCV